ncbi:hypothetical protein BDZ89DRAFT_1087465 [Hymenopellis radicata]|nr:hypothetical protein BDZ89DRAFT_1087465 [Hymenopellis radicata]
MLVCRRWHSLIMSDGYLWSFICIGLERYGLRVGRVTLEEHIRRSGNWPLHVYHHHSRRTDMIAYRFSVVPVSARLAALHINYVPNNLLEDIMNTLEESGLRELTTLILYSSSRDIGQDTFVLSKSVLALPKLSRLILTDVSVELSSLPAQLTELDLYFTTFNFPLYDIHELFSKLSSLPNLEVLKIRHAISNDRHPEQSLPLIHLPHLRVLTIFDVQDVVISFLTRLIIPAATTILISLHTIIEDAKDASRDMIAPLRKNFRYPGGTRIKAIKIRNLMAFDDDTTGCDLSIIGLRDTNVKLLDPFLVKGDGPKAMEFTFLTERGKIEKQFSRKLFTSLMMHAEVLDLRTMGRGPLSLSWWKMALLSLPALTEVYLSGDSSTCLEFCEALRKLMFTHPRNFPRLRGIYVRKFSQGQVQSMSRDDAETHYSELTDTALHRRNYLELAELVRTFKDMGLGLEWVTISNPDFTNGELFGKVHYNDDEVYKFTDTRQVDDPYLLYYNGHTKYY